MPKLGMEPIRRTALVDAAISEIGAAGTLKVTVSQIARRAGMSSALAHHYFGSKDRILIAAMRHILAQFGAGVRRRLANLTDPRARLAAIIDACFDNDQLAPDVVAAWLAFYTQAQTSDSAARLLKIYRRRLHSNLVHALVHLLPRAQAERVAVQIGALIDGLYIRQAVPDGVPGRMQTIAIINASLDLELSQARR